MSTQDLGIETISTTDAPKAAPKSVAEPKVKETEKQSASEVKPSDETPSDESDTSDKTTDDDESSEGDADGEAEKSDELDAKPKKKSGTQKRFDKLTKRLSDREREIEYWKGEALKAKTPTQEAQAQAKVETLEAKKPMPDGKPNAETWEGTHAEYIDALTDWKLDQAEKARTVKAEESKQAEKLQETLKLHTERVEKFKAEHADFDEALEDVDDVRMSHALQIALVESEFGPEIMYELSKNRAEYERIAKLDVRQLERVIGRMEAKIESAKASSTVADEDQSDETEIKKSKAPPPINPVSAKSKVSLKKTLDDMDPDEYLEWRRNKNRR